MADDEVSYQFAVKKLYSTPSKLRDHLDCKDILKLVNTPRLKKFRSDEATKKKKNNYTIYTFQQSGVVGLNPKDDLNFNPSITDERSPRSCDRFNRSSAGGDSSDKSSKDSRNDDYSTPSTSRNVPEPHRLDMPTKDYGAIGSWNDLGVRPKDGSDFNFNPQRVNNRLWDSRLPDYSRCSGDRSCPSSSDFVPVSSGFDFGRNRNNDYTPFGSSTD